MKRLMTAMACCVVGAFAWAQTEVHSVNVAGVLNVPVKGSGGVTMVGINLDPFDPSQATLKDVLGVDQLKPGGTFSSCDRVWLWDGTQYKMFGIKTSDTNWHRAENNVVFNEPATNPPLDVGDGFFIRTASSGSPDKEIVLRGQAVDADEVTIPIPVGPSVSFLSYPFSCSIDLQATDFANDGAKKGGTFSSCDRIWTWSNTQYVIYGLSSVDSKWHRAENNVVFAEPAVSNVYLEIGSGFWYKRPSSATNILNWSETNWYKANL